MRWFMNGIRTSTCRLCVGVISVEREERERERMMKMWDCTMTSGGRNQKQAHLRRTREANSSLIGEVGEEEITKWREGFRNNS